MRPLKFVNVASPGVLLPSKATLPAAPSTSPLVMTALAAVLDPKKMSESRLRIVALPAEPELKNLSPD